MWKGDFRGRGFLFVVYMKVRERGRRGGGGEEDGGSVLGFGQQAAQGSAAIQGGHQFAGPGERVRAGGGHGGVRQPARLHVRAAVDS